VNHDETLCRHIRHDPHGRAWDADLRAHADRCPACVAFLQSVAALGERLRAVPAFGAPMPSALRVALMDRLDACPESPTTVRARAARPFRARFAVPVAMAAALVAGILLGRNVHPGAGGIAGGEVPRTVADYIADVTHDHFLFARVSRPLEVAETDPDRLAGWLSGALGFSVRLPHHSDGFDLEGGRVWHTLGRLSALASYTAPDGRRVILFAVPAANIELSGAPSSVVHGVRVYTGSGWEREARVWIDGSLAVALVAPEGDLPESWADAFLP